MKTKWLLPVLGTCCLLLYFFSIDQTLPLTDPNPGGQTKARMVSLPTDTCDSPDAGARCCFAGMPAQINAEMIIAGPDEPGQRILINGRIFQRDGKTPAPGVLLYAYHTDAKGIYSKKDNETGVRKWQGRLHGWCRTDAAGRYSISTIRPASYPNSNISQHIHAVIWPEGAEPYFIEEFTFADDPFRQAELRKSGRKAKAEDGVVSLQKNTRGILEGQRDITFHR